MKVLLHKYTPLYLHLRYIIFQSTSSKFAFELMCWKVLARVCVCLAHSRKQFHLPLHWRRNFATAASVKYAFRALTHQIRQGCRVISSLKTEPRCTWGFLIKVDALQSGVESQQGESVSDLRRACLKFRMHLTTLIGVLLLIKDWRWFRQTDYGGGCAEYKSFFNY
jgi:hypothetical protein